MSIEKIIESLAMALTHSEQGEYAKNEEFVRTSLEEYGREVIKSKKEELSKKLCEGIGYGKYGFSRIEKHHPGEVAININDVLEEINNLK